MSDAEVLKALDRRAYRHATGQASDISLTQLEARVLLDIGADRRRLRKALHRLVALKDFKLTARTDADVAEYKRLKPEVWREAREALGQA